MWRSESPIREAALDHPNRRLVWKVSPAAADILDANPPGEEDGRF